MKYPQNVQIKLLAILIVMAVLNACSYHAVRLDKGTSFDETNRYALVVFGVRGYYHDNRSIQFHKFDLETGQADGSCLGGWDSISVSPPPKDAEWNTYMAFKVAPGSYLNWISKLLLPAYGDGSDQKIGGPKTRVSITVDAGHAYYVGNLIRNSWTPRTEMNYLEATNWIKSYLDLQVPLIDSPFKEYNGPALGILCVL